MSFRPLLAALALALSLAGCTGSRVPAQFADNCADMLFHGARASGLNAGQPFPVLTFDAPQHQGTKPRLQANEPSLRGIGLECRGGHALASIQ